MITLAILTGIVLLLTWVYKCFKQPYLSGVNFSANPVPNLRFNG